jgi:hypothetical protein
MIMVGSFRRIGESRFPRADSRQAATVYEWTSSQSGGRRPFRIRFLSPDQDGPRTFYVELILRDWTSGASGRFLDQACGHGYQVLCAINPVLKQLRAAFKLAQALFRNRTRGRNYIARKFESSIDFLDMASAPQPGVVIPGIDVSDVRRRRSEGVHDLARRVLRDTVGVGDQSANSMRGFHRVLHHLEQVARQSQTARSRPTHSPMLLPGDSSHPDPRCDALYQFALEWIDLTSDDMTVMGQAKSALIAERTTSDRWTDPLRDHDSVRHAIAKLFHAAKRKPSQFDYWLTNVREHRYLQLIGSSKCRILGRDQAAEQAQQIYCALLWLAHLIMARCYAGLMLNVYFDLCLHAEVKPSPEERWNFWERHLPRPYLGHLPLDFLGRHQLRWIARTLFPLLTTGEQQPAQYRPIPALLGLWGHLVRNRREADRLMKKQRSSHVQSYYAVDEMDDRDFRRRRVEEW